MLSQALRMAEALGDPRAYRVALFASKYHHCYCMRLPEAAERALRAAELLRAVGDLWHMTEMLACVQLWSVMTGRLDGVAQVGEEAEILSQRFGHMGAEYQGLLARGLTACGESR